jgi:hypothetical protein
MWRRLSLRHGPGGGPGAMADSILEGISAMEVLAILLWIKEGAYSRIYLGVNSLGNKVIFD